LRGKTQPTVASGGQGLTGIELSEGETVWVNFLRKRDRGIEAMSEIAVRKTGLLSLTPRGETSVRKARGGS